MRNLSVNLMLCGLLLVASRTNAVAAEAPAFQYDWQPPEFTALSADGEEFQYPGDLEGPTIVLFWATWCPFCKALMPHLQSIVDEYGDGIRVLALNFREDGDPAEFMANYGYEFDLFPSADAAAEAWGIKGTPGLFLADANGRVVFSMGAIPPEAYASRRFEGAKDMKAYQKAARVAPLWAALLRESLDLLIARETASQ